MPLQPAKEFNGCSIIEQYAKHADWHCSGPFQGRTGCVPVSLTWAGVPVHILGREINVPEPGNNIQSPPPSAWEALAY
jgi:hypothetical protein